MFISRVRYQCEKNKQSYTYHYYYYVDMKVYATFFPPTIYLVTISGGSKEGRKITNVPEKILSILSGLTKTRQMPHTRQYKIIATAYTITQY